MLELKLATKEQCKLRMVLIGISGSGKTYSALQIAKHLVPDARVLVLDSEYGSAKKYADVFKFFHINITDPDPRNYMKLIREAGKSPLDVLVLDSISHAWYALLDLVTEEGKKSNKPFGGWDKGSPIYKEFVETILASPLHIIATSRSKSEYDVSKDEKGKTKVTKIGTKPDQRENIEYEFDVAGNMDEENTLTIFKSRCSAIHRKSFYQPGKELADTLRAWLNSGEAPAPKPVDGVKEQKAETSKPAPATANANTASTVENETTTPETTKNADSGTQDTQTTTETAKESPYVGKEQMAQLLKVGTDNGWPKNAINAILKATGVKPDEITWALWKNMVNTVSQKYEEQAS
jgi:hypothetical protein